VSSEGTPLGGSTLGSPSYVSVFLAFGSGRMAGTLIVSQRGEGKTYFSDGTYKLEHEPRAGAPDKLKKHTKQIVNTHKNNTIIHVN